MEKKVNNRAFIDQGCQVRFVNQNLLKDVQYEHVRKEILRTYHSVDNHQNYMSLLFKYEGKSTPTECFVDNSVHNCKQSIN